MEERRNENNSTISLDHSHSNISVKNIKDLKKSKFLIINAIS